MATLRSALVVAAVVLGGVRGRAFSQGFTTVSLSNDPTRVVVADLNGDGKADLVVSNGSPHTVSVLLGNGAGGFPTKADYASGSTSAALGLATGDLNNDGALDVAVGGNYVLLGNGIGGLGTPTFFDAIATVKSLAALDVNQDGLLDLLTAAEGSSFSFGSVIFVPGGFKIQLGVGAGAFGPPQAVTMGSYYSGGSPFTAQMNTMDVQWADVSGDGLLDAVGTLFGHIYSPFGSYGLENLETRLGTGNANFGPLVESLVHFAGYGFAVDNSSLSLGDVTGDGLADAGIGSGGIMKSNGDGSFTYIASGFPVATGHGAKTLWLHDLNGDGLADAFGYYMPGKDFSTTLGTELAVPGPALAPPVEIVGIPSVSSPPNGAIGSDLAFGDFNGDGRVDAAVLCPLVPSACILLGNGIGGFEGPAAFSQPVSSVLGAVAGGVITLTADFDHDGYRDLVVGDGGAISVEKGSGNGTFANPTVVLANAAFTAAITGDFDRDGNVDLAATASDASRVFVLPGDGLGSFGGAIACPVGSAPVALAAGDLDGNGFVDLVSANFGGNSLSCVMNSNGAFAPHVDLSSGLEPSAVAVGDLNGDGRLDLVNTNYVSGNVGVFLGTGGGGFGPMTAFPCAAGPTGLDLGDLDGDGALDVAVAAAGPAGSQQQFVAILKGNGGGGLGASHDFLCSNAAALRIADLNGDGLQDIVVSRAGEPWFFVKSCAGLLMGMGGGAFSPPTTLQMTPTNQGNTRTRVAVDDVDSDGRLDLIATSDHAAYPAVRLNATGDPFGMSASGTGTHGCGGIHGIAANVNAKIGIGSFNLACSNAPPKALGLALVTDVANFNGLDPFSIGVTFYVDVLNTNYLGWFDIVSDRNGYALAQEPVPALPIFAGITMYTQVFWYWSDGCAPSPFGLSSSRVLATTLQP